MAVHQLPSASQAQLSSRELVPMRVASERLREKLTLLYGAFVATQALPKLMSLLAGRPRSPQHRPITEEDLVLVAYPDHVRSGSEPPLQALSDFLTEQIDGLVSDVHLLPFHTSTADGGFAVTNYDDVDPAFGEWADIAEIGESHGLMFDFVLNHVSTSHPWFKGFLAGNRRYVDYFTVIDDDFDTSHVVHPLGSSPITEFEVAGEKKRVWTTYGPGEADLNYRNPDVLLDVIRSILAYTERGARILRLNAVEHLWKRQGTDCLELAETHIIVQLLRDVLDTIDPSVMIATGTNLTHDESLSYLGNGANEAQLSDRNALPALLVHTMQSGDTYPLTSWAASANHSFADASFFNATATHDGIAIPPVSALLSTDEINAMAKRTIAHGGRTTSLTTAGSTSLFELNISYFDAISDPALELSEAINRFMVSQAMMLSLSGVPAVYLPSLFGARTWEAGASLAMSSRENNRERFSVEELHAALNDSNSRESLVFSRYSELLEIRRTQSAFDPFGSQKVLQMGPEVFGVERTSQDGSERILALHNVTGSKLVLLNEIGGPWLDLITGDEIQSAVALDPYQVLWLSKGKDRL